MSMLTPLRKWASSLKGKVVAIYFAARDPRTPLLAKAVAFAIAAYALSPIDLIPDFIPILGYLDDLLIVPLGLALAARLIPPDVLADAEAKAASIAARPSSYFAAAFIIVLWVAAGIASAQWLWAKFRHS